MHLQHLSEGIIFLALHFPFFGSFFSVIHIFRYSAYSPLLSWSDPLVLRLFCSRVISRLNLGLFSVTSGPLIFHTSEPLVYQSSLEPQILVLCLSNLWSINLLFHCPIVLQISESTWSSPLIPCPRLLVLRPSEFKIYSLFSSRPFPEHPRQQVLRFSSIEASGFWSYFPLLRQTPFLISKAKTTSEMIVLLLYLQIYLMIRICFLHNIVLYKPYITRLETKRTIFLASIAVHITQKDGALSHRSRYLNIFMGQYWTPCQFLNARRP